MNRMLAFALFPLLFLGSPVSAQSLCADCLKASQDQLKQCLESAISAEDKKSCLERQEAKGSLWWSFWKSTPSRTATGA